MIKFVLNGSPFPEWFDWILAPFVFLQWILDGLSKLLGG